MSNGAIKLQPREPNTPVLTNVLHSPKRVRVKFAGETVADSREALILRSNQFLPIYFFPKSSVRTGLLDTEPTRSKHELGFEVLNWGLTIGDRTSLEAAWSPVEIDDPALQILKDHIAFRWKSVDQWFEEDEEIFVHPRDPYARVDTISSSSHLQVKLNGEVIADTTNAVFLFETHLPTRYYIPPSDIRMDTLTVSSSTSRCPYKGIASYWSYSPEIGEDGADVAWSYEAPLPEIPKIKGLIAFYPQAVDEIRVDGKPVS
ncbi:DUF427 domain-containing protein [Rhizobium sp. NZLR1]|uniref:DUF427 domain-containing protein n=1 Tax=Rhizobium sp. NZLR1 TaxID=2731096 RepID=UPI001A99AE8C|nr:DUF427 domain-containing protein [Rhizobium sp. NZLR1]MBX5204072.1 DUF427 domain-containing protein [Rhizobium sp. NZLR1]QSZ25132.1 DUF427 domain-containing protein [Rhizobium sp. NZLR1]